MNFLRVTDLTAPDNSPIPGSLFLPESPIGGAVVCHPYGGLKEEMFGLAAAIAQKGVAALAIDLRGHGENRAPIGPGVRDDVEAGLAYVRRFGRAAAVGQSLGGRLALMSSADCIVAISPAVIQAMSLQGKWMFENFPSPAVREPYPGYVLELLDALGPVPGNTRPCLLVYAERDIPAIYAGAAGLTADLPGAQVRRIGVNIRPEVEHENGFIRYLPRWFNHGELKFNAEVLRTVPDWISEQLEQTRR
ncbi:MAG: alpha/beta hydrolase [Rudaea sp.]